MHLVRHSTTPPWARVFAIVMAFASWASGQQFDELAGRGLPRVIDDTHVVVLCDLDGDGHLDLLFGVDWLFPGRPLELYLGSPDAVFVAAPAGSMTSTPMIVGELICADLDGDGDGDVFVANRDYQQNRLLLNDGTGQFVDATATHLPVSGDDSRAAACADVDGDSDLDIVVGNVLGPDRLLINDGSGRFSWGPTLPDRVSDDATAMVFLDADADGIPDLAVGNSRGQNRLWHNDGMLGFVDVTASTLPTDLDVTSALAVLDVDGDGAPDLIVGNRGSPDRVYRNDGAGRFSTDPTWTPSEAGPTSDLAVFDADADGDVDVFVARWGEADRLLVNDGVGAFRAARRPWPEAVYHTDSVAAGDVDLDGDVDVVTGNGRSIYAPSRKRLLLNDGVGSFASSTAVSWLVPDAESTAVVLGDLDSDGAVDVVVGAGVEVETWFGDGFGGLGGRQILRSGVSPDVAQALALGDVDGDGDLDLLVGTSSSNVLLRNDGAGVFTADPTAIPIGGFDTRAVGLFDADGDGDLDVVECNAGSSPQFAQQNRLLVNDGTGLFTDDTANRLPATADFTFGLAVSDVDADGDADLVLGNWSVALPTSPRQPNRLLLNDGTGRFADAPVGQLPLDDDPTATLALGDVDGDGDDDLLVGNMRAPNRLYRNDGLGTFVLDSAALPSSAHPTRSIGLADGDGDGDLDVFLGNDDFPNGYLRNDGAAGFVDATASAWRAVRDATTGIALGDVDGDGDPDLFVVNRAGQQDRLLANLSRHLDIPIPMRSGRSFDIDVYARSAQGLPMAGLWMSDRSVPGVSLPPFGVLRLDPNMLVDLGALPIPAASGLATFRFTLPVAPGLVGRVLLFQALVYDPASFVDSRLTNVSRRTVGG